MKIRQFILILMAGFVMENAVFGENLKSCVKVSEPSVELFEKELQLQKKDAKAFDSFITKYGSVCVYQDTVTVFYLLPKASSSEELNIFTNLPEMEKGVKMDRFPKTTVFYKSFQIDDSIKFVTYSFRKKVGHFLRDPYNSLVYCDARKSSLMRLSDKVGGFVLVSDYEKKYEHINSRSNLVYLPAAYFNEPDKSFPVIYWLDGQNLWDYKMCPWGGWKVDTIMERLVRMGRIKPFIIAGVSNSSKRTGEYAGWCKKVCEEEAQLNHEDINEMPLCAEEHKTMLVEDYIPYIEKHFRVLANRENRFIAGSSYGAYNSAWMIEQFPSLFGGAGLFSGGQHGYRQLMDENAFGKEKCKIYLDCGNNDKLERILIKETRNLKNYLLSKWYIEGKNLYYKEIRDGRHNEMEWSRRVPLFLEFISKEETE